MSNLLRTILIIPAAELFMAGAGAALCAAMGWHVHAPALFVAAGAALIASLLAVAPLILTRGATQATVSQAALGATMIHMFGFAASLAIVILGHVSLGHVFLGNAFTYWLLPFYFATLIGVVAACVAAIRVAPAGR